jgi:hypothetical protein
MLSSSPHAREVDAFFSLTGDRASFSTLSSANHRASSTSASSPSLSPSDLRLAASFRSVKKQLVKVASQIKAVEFEIRLTTASSLSPSIDADERAFLRDKEKQLRDEKKLLLEKENQFREEQKLLLEKENQLRNEKMQLHEQENKQRREEEAELFEEKVSWNVRVCFTVG